MPQEVTPRPAVGAGETSREAPPPLRALMCPRVVWGETTGALINAYTHTHIGGKRRFLSESRGCAG